MASRNGDTDRVPRVTGPLTQREFDAALMRITIDSLRESQGRVDISQPPNEPTGYTALVYTTLVRRIDDHRFSRIEDVQTWVRAELGRCHGDRVCALRFLNQLWHNAYSLPILLRGHHEVGT